MQPWDKVSKLVNDAWYITKAVSDLTNYYTKNQTYTKAEIDALIANFAWFKVVTQLPTTDIKTTLIYLLWPSANNTYEEYVYIDNQWVKIGETSMDLTNYFHKTNDDSDDIIEGSTHLFMTPAERTNLSHQSGTNTWDETQASIQNKLGVATSTKSGYLSSGDWNTFNNKQDKLVAWANIQINGNVISATTGSTYSAWDYISIDSNNTISNTKPFVPANTWSAWQILTKTSNWYRRETGSGGWGWVTSVNWRTGDVTVQEFDPDNSWDAGQVLKKTSGGYVWANESWGQWNFNPESAGTTGQVLTKTANGYDWQTIAWWEGNVKLFTLSSTSDTTNAQAAYDWYNSWKLPIIRMNATISRIDSTWTVHNIEWDFDFYPEPDSTDNWKLKFYTIHNWENCTITQWWSQKWDYTSDVDIMLILSISWWNVTSISQTTQTNSQREYLATNVDYTNPYIPQYPWSPATKAYVDSVAWWWSWITNNTTGTTSTINQEWAWTQAEYDALVNSWQIMWWVIYNILPS